MMEAALDARGESMRGGERGSPLSYRGSGEIMVPEKRFKTCFRSKCQVSNLIVKASLTYFCNILLQF